MRTLHDFPGGIHPPEHKLQSSESPIRQAALPALLQLAVRQSMGNAAIPCVTVGQRVRKGEIIARADGRISANLHAPTSGLITAIAPAPFAHPSGLPELTISLQSDGREEWGDKPALSDWQMREGSEIAEHLAQMGVVGLGGAVFPTQLKLRGQIDTLVINGAECEPYITCDDRLMRERADTLCEGIAIARHAVQAREVLIGIEDNKPQAIAAMRAAAARHGFEVVPVPTKYPSGGAKQLIYLLTGKAIPHGTRSTSLGVQSLNVGTCYAIARAVLHGEPLISRIVTVSGAVKDAANFEALIGTPASELLAQAGVEPDCDSVVLGGPMMGFTLPSHELGLTKAGNCLLAKSQARFPPRPAASACIRCGDCASACPVSLQPMDLYWHAKARQFDKARDLYLMDCIECGACSYVCPSQIPLVDYYRFAKSEIWAADRDSKAAELARQRHEFRQFRIERDKSEKAQRMADRAAAQAEKLAAQAAAKASDTPAADSKPASGMDDSKRAAIAAAMARAAARQPDATETLAASPEPAGMTEEKRAAIEAAMARAAARKAAKAAESSEAPAEAEAGTTLAPSPEPAGMTEEKRAAIEAAMARAAARKAAKAAESSEAPATPQATATLAASPEPAGMTDEKRAAIEAAMARAAARKAAKAAESSEAPVATEAGTKLAASPEPAGMTDEKRAAIEAAMARAAARKAAKAAENPEAATIRPQDKP